MKLIISPYPPFPIASKIASLVSKNDLLCAQFLSPKYCVTLLLFLLNMSSNLSIIPASTIFQINPKSDHFS